jgi:hypothetical protein
MQLSSVEKTCFGNNVTILAQKNVTVDPWWSLKKFRTKFLVVTKEKKKGMLLQGV